MPTRSDHPRLSVVVPTYNRCDLLRKTLSSLVRQKMSADDFEVVVSDDGSSDDTSSVVRSFMNELHLAYHLQPDRGFRVAAARNAGAKLATAPLIVFLDSGALAGSGFLCHHLDAHGDDRPRTAAVGLTYGYDPAGEVPGLREALSRMSPEEVVARYEGDPAFLDLRHDELSQCDFDLGRKMIPWRLFYTGNCSVRADDFRAVGGFDEDFRGWGLEDLELGYRLFERGVRFSLHPDAWVIESPHNRDMDARMAECRRNSELFLCKHPDPAVEIGWLMIKRRTVEVWEDEYEYLTAWRREVADLDVSGELRQALQRLPSAGRIAVFGVGGYLPMPFRPAVVLDFDKQLLDRAVTVGRCDGHHTIGLRTPLPDKSFDAVIITSRLAGPLERWGEELLAEAHRIGRDVRVLAGAHQ